MAPPLELVSFKICPFVQRSVITLLEKEVDFEVTYIDLADKPAWFEAISPLGKVPVLRVGETVLFESAVINEYLDEVNPPPLHPADPLEKARHRAFIEVGSDLLGRQYRAYVRAGDAAAFEQARAGYVERLDHAERAMPAGGPLFAGEHLSLVDCAWAPLFMHQGFYDALAGGDALAGHPRLARWCDALLERGTVQRSVTAHWSEYFRDYMRRKGGYLAA